MMRSLKQKPFTSPKSLQQGAFTHTGAVNAEGLGTLPWWPGHQPDILMGAASFNGVAIRAIQALA